MADADIELRLTRRTIDGPFEAFGYGFFEAFGKVLAWGLLILFVAWYFDLPREAGTDTSPQATTSD